MDPATPETISEQDRTRLCAFDVWIRDQICQLKQVLVQGNVTSLDELRNLFTELYEKAPVLLKFYAESYWAGEQEFERCEDVLAKQLALSAQVQKNETTFGAGTREVKKMLASRYISKTTPTK